jgi:large subunit ribosomal protein L9
MKVILQEDVKNLGEMGQIVRVKDGYGRNFLLPRGLAVMADERNIRQLQHNQRLAKAKAAKEKAVSEDLAAKILEAQLTITREAGEDDKLFGAVTNRDIAESLAAEGIELDRRRINLPEPIKALGRYEVQASLDRGVKATIIVFVQR